MKIEVVKISLVLGLMGLTNSNKYCIVALPNIGYFVIVLPDALQRVGRKVRTRAYPLHSMGKFEARNPKLLNTFRISIFEF